MKIKGLLTAALAAAMLVSGCSTDSGAAAVTVGDKTVSEGAVRFMCDYGGSQDAQHAADSLKQNYLVNAVAEAMNIELTDDDAASIKDQIATTKAQIFGGYSAAKKGFKEYGIDDSLLETIFKSNLYAHQLMEQLETAEATDEEKKQYFKDNYLRAKHVLILTTDQMTGEPLSDEEAEKAKTTADEVLEKAKSGADFNALIDEYNEDPGMLTNKDGYVFTDGTMMKEFEDTTKSLQPGEIGMCQTSYGYHIIQRLALDETPELFDKFYNEQLSAIENVISSKKYDEALEAKAEELGITVEENQAVIDGMSAESDDASETEEPANE